MRHIIFAPESHELCENRMNHILLVNHSILIQNGSHTKHVGSCAAQLWNPKKKTFSKNLCKRGEQADFFFPKRPNLSPLCERHIFVHVIQKHVSLPCFCYSPLYSCDAKREWPTLCALSFCMLMCWLSINATTRACKLSGGPL